MDEALDLFGILDIASTVLTPVAILFASVWFSSQARRQASQNEKFAALVEKRVALWDRLAFPLNDIYVYFLFVGHWKELSERDIVAAKRSTDRIVFAYRPFFSAQFFNAYTTFMDEAFLPYRGGHGSDAKLRAVNIRPLDHKAETERFTDEDNGAAIHKAYYALLMVAADEFDLMIDLPVAPETPKTKRDLAG